MKGLGGMASLMKQANQMQIKMKKLQEVQQKPPVESMNGT